MADPKKGADRSKLPNGGNGRPKGAQNKTTTTLKQAILAAAAKHGHDGDGEEGLEGYLTMVAEKDVKSFCALLGKVLPMTVANDPDNPFEIISKIELVGVKAK